MAAGNIRNGQFRRLELGGFRDTKLQIRRCFPHLAAFPCIGGQHATENNAVSAGVRTRNPNLFRTSLAEGHVLSGSTGIGSGAGGPKKSIRLTVGSMSTRSRRCHAIFYRINPWTIGITDPMLRLTSLSFAHPAVLSDSRARLSLVGPALDNAHGLFLSQGEQVFLLSTCLRVEIAWTGGPETSADRVGRLYGDGSLSDLGVLRSDEAAFVHLCRVVAGLDSPLVGEPEVLGQFRHAVAVWRRVSPDPGSLGRVLEAAIGIGRNSRRLSGNAPRGSLAAVAAREAARFERVAILGAGVMARAAAEQLDGADVSIFARRPSNVAGRASLAWKGVAEALATYPVVISTVPGKAPLLSDKALAAALGSRTEPVTVIDLAMPPGFTRPEPGGPMRYLGIDDVASSVNAETSAESEESVTRWAAAAWHRITAPDRVGRVIAMMVRQADELVSEESGRFAGRLQQAQDPDQVMRQLAHTVARRILHAPISFLASSERGVGSVDLLAEAFGLDDE